MKFLKKAQEMMPERNLRYRLHEHLNRLEDPRPISVLHASELCREEGFCPRAYALMDVTETLPAKKWVNTSVQVTYALGHRLQDAVIDWFAQMELAVTNWQCLSCEVVHEMMKRPLKCHHCRCKALRPVEPRFVSTETGASCGIDLLIDRGLPKLTLVEIKTIDKDAFKDLLAPLAEHRQRTAFYLRIVSESDHPRASHIDTSEARIVYVSKGGFGVQDPELAKWGMKERFSPFKEFKVARDDSLCEEPSRKALAVSRFRLGEVGMPNGICDTPMCKRAKDCPVKAACFSGDHPGVHDWASG